VSIPPITVPKAQIYFLIPSMFNSTAILALLFPLSTAARISLKSSVPIPAVPLRPEFLVSSSWA